jgi:glycine/D-amino acid oxidase-like deaminating enzyme
MFKHVIIGGGVTGASIAYHLSKITSGRIALIEKNTFGSGQTALSAGLILHHHSTHLGKKMAEQTFLDIHYLKKNYIMNYKQTASIQLSNTDNNVMKYPFFSHCLDKNPILRIPTEEFVRYNELDSYVNPQDLLSSYLREAKTSGATLFENTKVMHMGVHPTGDIVLQTQNGKIRAENIINATGYQVDQFTPLPVTNLRSHYWIARNATRASPILPILLLPGMYIRTHGYMMDIGIQEKQSKQVAEISQDDATDILLEQTDTLKKYIKGFDNLHIQQYISGISSYTADGLPVIRQEGPITSIAGCCGYGLTWAGGIGKMIASREIPPELCASRFDHMKQETLDAKALDIRHNKFK